MEGRKEGEKGREEEKRREREREGEGGKERELIRLQCLNTWFPVGGFMGKIKKCH